MNTTVEKVSSAGKDNHLLLLSRDAKSFDTTWFSDTEISFIRQELKDDKKVIVINQYNRYIIIQVLKNDQPERYQYLESCRKAGALLTARFNAVRLAEITVNDQKADDDVLALIEGMVLSNYQFLKYRKEKVKEKHTLNRIKVKSDKITGLQLNRLSVIADANGIARDLVNEPQSFLTATELSKQFETLGKAAGFKTQVFNKAKITSLKMGGLLAVNLGSIEPPTFTVMEWKPNRPVNKKPIVLVGKGVVYDTGGMSLKPTPNSMDYMKCDMAGGAVVGAVLYALAKAKVQVHVIGLVPATDNRPDGNAYVPGDVITMMSGTTVEVLNTDAEGRLILADALHYAKQFNPELVMDFATLTGAASAAIGHYGIVAMGTAKNPMRKKLCDSANQVYERLAEFPFWDEYGDLIKSDIADLKNVGGPSAGAITAGKFLAHFTDYPYMHFDIAGPAFNKTNDSYRGKNGTGVGVRFMFEFFTRLASRN